MSEVKIDACTYLYECNECGLTKRTYVYNLSETCENCSSSMTIYESGLIW